METLKKNLNPKMLFTLFFTFAKIGCVTFGGGYAMLPILERDIVDKHHWATLDELTDYFAIGQCTPGVIAVNTATFIGYKTAGILGGIVATLGVVTPSIIIIQIIAAFILHFADNQYVKHAFSGIRVCVTALVLASVIKLGKKSLKNALSVGIFLAVFILATFFKVSPVILIFAAAAVGIITYVFIKKDYFDNQNTKNGGDNK